MDKLIIREDILFNAEILSILFNATEQTQKPFINRVVKGIEWAKRNGFVARGTGYRRYRGGRVLIFGM